MIMHRKALVAVSIPLLFAACSIYDNYDPDLMPGAVASIEDVSSCSAVSSSSETPVSSGSETPVSSGSETPVSSSSETPVSSSEEPVSSSSVWDCSDSTLEYQGYVYKIAYVKEKKICFTAENMRYAPKNAGDTRCFDDGESDSAAIKVNCEKYGLLYNYKAAEHACPKGWHLPSVAELDTLMRFTGVDEPMRQAGTFFKAKSGWDSFEEDGNGSDVYGFSGLPGGACEDDGDCYGLGALGAWWTSDAKSAAKTAYDVFILRDNDASATTEGFDIESFASVRCFRD